MKKRKYKKRRNKLQRHDRTTVTRFGKATARRGGTSTQPNMLNKNVS